MHELVNVNPSKLLRIFDLGSLSKNYVKKSTLNSSISKRLKDLGSHWNGTLGDGPQS